MGRQENVGADHAALAGVVAVFAVILAIQSLPGSVGGRSDLSYLDEQVQKWVYEYFKENGFLKPVQVEALKNYPNLSNVTQFSVISIMNDALPKKSKESKLSFSAKKLDKYFPPQYSTKERESIIIQLLEQWSADQVQSE